MSTAIAIIIASIIIYLGLESAAAVLGAAIRSLKK